MKQSLCLWRGGHTCVIFFGGLPTLGQRWAAGQKAVGPTSAAIVGPTDVPTLARRWPDVSMLSGTGV